MYRAMVFAAMFLSFSAYSESNLSALSNVNPEHQSMSKEFSGVLDKGIAWKAMGKEVDGIRLYYGDIEGSNYEAFKGTVTVSSDLKTLVRIFQDTDRMHEWMYSTASVKVLENISPTESVRYLINEIPYPFMNDRDIVVRTKIDQKKDRSITIRMVKTDDIKPKVSGKVRIPYLDTAVTMKPLGDGTVAIEYFGHIDPGGVIMAATYNLMLKDTPFNTLNDFRKKIVTYSEKENSDIDYILN